MAKEKISPGMQQYLDIKENYPDAFLLFRMGDFYELFYDDAVKAAQILEISLTSRNKNADNPIPMAGVPYHSAQSYIDVLVEMGYKVAIAEQMEDPKQAVGVVKREVVQVITPGTVVDSSKPDNANNFLVAIDKAGSRFGLAYMDVSTGEFFATELDDFSSVCSEIQNLKAREVVLGYDLPEADEQVLVKQLNLLLSKETEVYDDVHLIDTSLTDLESSVAGKLLQYVHRTQMRELSHLQKAQHYEIKDYLQMSYATKSSLDLLENARTGKKHGSLFWLLDETKTAMGMRLLRTWIDRPLVNQAAIMERQNIIQVFLDNFFERSDLTESNGISNYTSQNMGAGKMDRVKEGFGAGRNLVWLLCVPLVVLYFFFGRFLLLLFMNDPQGPAIDTGMLFLRILSPFYFVVSVKLVADGILRGCGLMVRFMIATFTDLILRVGIAAVLSATALVLRRTAPAAARPGVRQGPRPADSGRAAARARLLQ